MESMLYYTSALIDNYEGQDIDVESAVIKSFCIDTIFKNATLPLETFGPGSLLTGEKTEQNIRDVLHLATIGETMDAVRLFIGLTGFQHAGVKNLNIQLFNFIQLQIIILFSGKSSHRSKKIEKSSFTSRTCLQKNLQSKRN